MRPSEEHMCYRQPKFLASKKNKPAVANGCDYHQYPCGNFLIVQLWSEPSQALDKGQRIIVFKVLVTGEGEWTKTEETAPRSGKRMSGGKSFRNPF